MRLVFFVVPVLVLASAAPAQTSGSASGVMILNQQKFELKHGFAHVVRDMFGTKKEAVEGWLADQPLTAEMMDDSALIVEAVREGKMNALHFELGSEGN